MVQRFRNIVVYLMKIVLSGLKKNCFYDGHWVIWKRIQLEGVVPVQEGVSSDERNISVLLVGTVKNCRISPG